MGSWGIVCETRGNHLRDDVIADGIVHEAVTHLAQTHLLIEPFVVCTFRQLAPWHPVSLLLQPHFQGTLTINHEAWRHLIADKGAVDKLFGGTIRSTRSLRRALAGSACVRTAEQLPE